MGDPNDSSQITAHLTDGASQKVVSGTTEASDQGEKKRSHGEKTAARCCKSHQVTLMPEHTAVI
ncbi:hypothetical protein QS257_15835 [Terrilactibacillus sp. S3-3]|nr:hypothetical protein QS257_15835 [Terrilactibacillus sp. S3-3]